MSNKTPGHLLRSNSSSYYGMLRPYLSEYGTYATLPAEPRNSNQLPPWPRRSSAAGGAGSGTNSSKSLSHSSSLRAFNFNVNPLWRHTTPSHHFHHNHKLPHRSATTVIGESKTGSHSKCMPSPSPLGKDFRPRASLKNEVIMQRSLPIFEVLPPLTVHDAGSQQQLLYQNEYVLDGVKYDWNSTAMPQGKLKMDYFKFLKSITTKAKPSDRDVIFGNAKVLFRRQTGWERSRIEWLVELERRQEWRSIMRRSKRQQRERNKNNSNNHYNGASCCNKLESTAGGGVTQHGKMLDKFSEDEEADKDSLLGDFCFPWGKNTLNTLMWHVD